MLTGRIVIRQRASRDGGEASTGRKVGCDYGVERALHESREAQADSSSTILGGGAGSEVW